MISFSRVFRVLVGAWIFLFHPLVFLLFATAAILGAMIWGGILYFFGGWLLSQLGELFSVSFVGFWGWLVLTVLSAPLIYFFTFVTLAWLAMPWVKSVVLKHEKARSGERELGPWFQLIEILRVGLGLGFVLLLGLVMAWLPVLAGLLVFVGVTWAQARLALLDLSGSTRSEEEHRERWKTSRWELLLLSGLMTWLAVVPFLGFFVPVYAAVVFCVWERESQHDKI